MGEEGWGNRVGDAKDPLVVVIDLGLVGDDTVGILPTLPALL